MTVYVCSACDTEYDEDKENVRWNDLPADWVCPVCDSGEPFWQRVGWEPDTFEDSEDTAGQQTMEFNPG